MAKIYNIEKAMEQMAYRLQNGKYEPNQNDLDAFKFMAEWINREKAKEITQNILFAKLFCHTFAQEVEYYKGDFKFAQAIIHEYLKHPIEFYYDKFVKKINDCASNQFIGSLGNQHTSLGYKMGVEQIGYSEDDKKVNSKIILDNQIEIEKHFLGIYEEDKVYASLNNTITEFINKYKNLP
jgi:hypothetical protein